MINPQIIDTITQIAEKNRQNVFLVGGYVRDMVLGVTSNDYDFVVSGDALAFSQVIATAFGGRLIILDQETQTTRIIFSQQSAVDSQQSVVKIPTSSFFSLPTAPPLQPTTYIDISPLKGTDIIHDLQLRDITINSLAINLLQPGSIIDPLNGLDDLKQKRIQIIGRHSIIDDPLRLIRAVRFSAQLQFTITPGSIAIIKELAHLISTVAIERIVYELFLIMSVEYAHPYIVLTCNLGLLKEIIPEIVAAKDVPQNEFHHLDVWNHLLQTLFHLEDICHRLEELFPKWHQDIQKYLQEEISGTNRYCLLKLASILHDIGKPACASIENGRLRFFGHDLKSGDMMEIIGIRMKLSAKQTESLKCMVTHHMRPGYLVEAEKVTDRAVYRFFKATQQEGIAVLLLSLADRYATMGPASSVEGIEKHYETVCYLMEKLYSHQPSANPPRLINGHDLMEYLCLPSSPLIGRLLQAVEEGAAEGRITGRMAALEYAREVLSG
ncbi:MAG: hypothetical protein V1749_04600 [Candidatus Desantisbacteria bacterium]